MTHAIHAVTVFSTLMWTISATAQSGPPTVNRDLIGSGPKVDVQTSANGTIDVGGARSADVNMTGENLRGSLGGSPLGTGVNPAPAPPAIGLPNYSFGSPNLGPNLPGASRGAVADRKPTNEDVSAMTELILPRFRAMIDEPRGSDAWRYRYFNGRWWYWKPNRTWVYWQLGQWLDLPSRS